MSDNLAHKLNNYDLGVQPRVMSTGYNSNSPELVLNRMKFQASKPQTSEIENKTSNSRVGSTNTGGSPAQQLNQAKNIASKALSGDVSGSAEETAGLGAQVGTQWLLTTLWGAVWVDWTLLSLLGLNVFLVFSLLLPNYVCQFGDDYLIGKWIPSKDLAKWTEIMILMIINVFVLSIIVIFIVMIYGITQLSWWDIIKIGASTLTGGVSAGANTAAKSF